jgi:uncharacterized protein
MLGQPLVRRSGATPPQVFPALPLSRRPRPARDGRFSAGLLGDGQGPGHPLSNWRGGPGGEVSSPGESRGFFLFCFGRALDFTHCPACYHLSGMELNLPFDRDRLSRFCRERNIRRLAVFGSAARGELGPESDIDVLVEFDPEARIGLSFITIQDELTHLLGRPVDLNTPGFLSPAWRGRVLAEAVPLYEAA